MADQSVIDIKFEDVLARDLKAVLGKTLDGLVRDLIASSKAAVGTGQLTNLGIIPTKEGAIGGVRFAVDSARRNDVQKAMRDLLDSYAERAGVGKIASVLSNTNMQAFSEPFIRLPNNDPAFAKSVLDYINRSGGEVLWSENYKDYIALRARMPHSHLAGSKLSTIQQLNQYKSEATDIITNKIKADRLAADAESIRKKDTGYVSEADLETQEDRRRKLGIVTDEDTPDVASAQEKKAFNTKALTALTAIVALLRKITSAMWKLMEQSIQTHYESMSYGVNANTLTSFQNALENRGLPRNEANKAVGAVVGGLINRFNLDEGLIQRLAPVMGEDLAGTVSQMLSKSHDPFGALQMIMENARRQVENPGSVWDVPSMSQQLGVFGPSFLGYMRWLKDQKNPAGKNFYDFLGIDPAKYVDEAAAAGLGVKQITGRAKHFLQNVGRSILGSGVKLPGAEGVYQRLGIDPSEMSLEDLIEALSRESDAGINKYYQDRFGMGVGRNGMRYYRQEMNKDIEALEKELERIRKSTTSMLGNPLESTSGSLVESMSYGVGGTGTSFGGTVYNEIDNSINSSTAAGGGSMDISLNIRGGNKDMGTYPLEMNANNMITIDWS